MYICTCLKHSPVLNHSRKSYQTECLRNVKSGMMNKKLLIPLGSFALLQQFHMQQQRMKRRTLKGKLNKDHKFRLAKSLKNTTTEFQKLHLALCQRLPAAVIQHTQWTVTERCFHCQLKSSRHYHAVATSRARYSEYKPSTATDCFCGGDKTREISCTVLFLVNTVLDSSYQVNVPVICHDMQVYIRLPEQDSRFN